MISQAFFFASIFKNHGQVAPWGSALSQVLVFFANTFLGPIGATGITLFYYDQRVRKEGFDIEWMMQSAGLMPPEPTPLPVPRPDEIQTLAGTAEPPLNPLHFQYNQRIQRRDKT